LNDYRHVPSPTGPRPFGQISGIWTLARPEISRGGGSLGDLSRRRRPSAVQAREAVPAGCPQMAIGKQ
jgi:hypothetical protein